MPPLAKSLLVLVAIVIIVLAFVGQGWAHSWYDFQCCNEKDCRQTVLKEVERRNDGWYVVPTNELIPYNDKRIRRSLDPLIHVCLFGKPQKVRCLYVPEMPV